MKTVIHYKSDPYLPITETWIYGQIKNLKTYKPVVYCYGTDNLDIYPVEHIRSLEFKKPARGAFAFFNKRLNRIFISYPFFKKSLLEDKPDLVHAHYGTSGYDFLRLAKIFRLPLITTFYGFDLSPLPSQNPAWRKRYNKLFAVGKLFLVEGNHMKKCLIELGCSQDKILVQHLGVDTDKIKFQPRKLRDEGEIRILISAHFREKKGIPYAVEAFAKVSQAHPELNLKLTIIGDSAGAPREEEEKSRIFNIIQKYNLGEQINLLGYQRYPVFIKELYNHHLFLQPSVQSSDGDTEGGAPVSIIEASASGMPVLATRHCDIPEVVIDNESGYLVPERNVDALAEKLEFLVLNPPVWEKMGQKGREHIEENYNVKKQVERLEEIYDSVLDWQKIKQSVY